VGKWTGRLDTFLPMSNGNGPWDGDTGLWWIGPQGTSAPTTAIAPVWSTNPMPAGMMWLMNTSDGAI